MTLTSPSCPVAEALPQQVKRKIEDQKNITKDQQRNQENIAEDQQRKQESIVKDQQRNIKLTNLQLIFNKNT